MGYEARRYYGDRTSTGALFFYAVLLFVPLGIWAFLSYMNTLEFIQKCSGHLSRAGHANSILTAEEELIDATTYLETHGLIQGYTSIFESLRTPNEDIEFWYKNLKTSLDQLRMMPKEISALERSNVLLKLRETLIHNGPHGEEVVYPQGIARYPHNLAWAITLVLSVLVALGGFGMFTYILNR